VNIAMVRLSGALEDPRYLAFARNNIRFVFKHMPYFKKQYTAGMCEYEMLQVFRMDMLDDCGAMGAGLMDVYPHDKDQRYLDYIRKAADYVKYKEHRLEDGTFVRTGPHKMTLWADDLYMSVPFMARYARLTGDTTFYDDAIRQVVNFEKYLRDECTGLYYHCWFTDLREHGVAHWGRSNGWVMMAEVELLSILPDTYPRRKEVVDILQRHVLNASRYQSQDGLWHQLLDKQDSYLETSVTAMFTYSIALAVNRGWLDKRYSSIALRGWEGIKSRIRPDGQVEGICQGTGIRNDLNYYYTRGTPLNDIHGLGAILLAGIEVLELKKGYVPDPW
jgi:rhamnogalacturonyl hydrolase YesR